MAVTVGTSYASVVKSSNGVCIGFPDVCKMPAPPAPFTPVPYPNTQLEENLKKANAADAKARAGDKKAQADCEHAINALYQATGKKARSASQATQIGYVVHMSGTGAVTEGKNNAIAATLQKKTPTVVTVMG